MSIQDGPHIGLIHIVFGRGIRASSLDGLILGNQLIGMSFRNIQFISKLHQSGCMVMLTQTMRPFSMSAIAHAVIIVKKWEGCKLEAYPDPATGGAPWTIGYGATGPGIAKGLKWSQKQAEDRLALDLDRFMDGVKSVLRHKVNDRQLAAMTSLAYNIGVGAFKGSTLLRKFNAGDIEGAANEFPRWNKAAGKVMRGLTNRRLDEQALFRS